VSGPVFGGGAVEAGPIRPALDAPLLALASRLLLVALALLLLVALLALPRLLALLLLVALLVALALLLLVGLLLLLVPWSHPHLTDGASRLGREAVPLVAAQLTLAAALGVGLALVLVLERGLPTPLLVAVRAAHDYEVRAT
jgi:hypothetical protein